MGCDPSEAAWPCGPCAGPSQEGLACTRPDYCIGVCTAGICKSEQDDYCPDWTPQCYEWVGCDLAGNGCDYMPKPGCK